MRAGTLFPNPNWVSSRFTGANRFQFHRQWGEFRRCQYQSRRKPKTVIWHLPEWALLTTIRGASPATRLNSRAGKTNSRAWGEMSANSTGVGRQIRQETRINGKFYKFLRTKVGHRRTPLQFPHIELIELGEIVRLITHRLSTYDLFKAP